MMIVVVVAVPTMLPMALSNVVAEVTARMVVIATGKANRAKGQRSHGDESGEAKLH
jgi:hypothetical protein